MRRMHGTIDASAAIALVAVVVVLALIVVLPHVGRARVADAGRTRLEVWSHDIAGESLERLAPAFERARPDVDVDVKLVGNQLRGRFLLSLASGRGGPDVAQLQEREAGKFTTTHRLADCSSWASKYAHDFAPAFWQTCLVGDRVYAIPWDIAPCAVFYKRWIFEKYHVDADAIETWDDFIAVGESILRQSNGRTKMLPLAPNALSYPFQMWMQQAGGGIFGADGSIVFDNAHNADALELVRRLLDSGIASPIFQQTELNVAYADDSVATFPSASWNIGFIKSVGAARAGEWGVFRLPAYQRGGVRNSNQGGSVLVIPASSPAIAQASAYVEQTLCTVDAQVVQFKDYGLFPAYLPALRDPRFDVVDPFFGDQHVATLFARDVERVKPMIRTRDWDEAEQMIGVAMYRWARERQDTRTFLRETAAMLARRLNRPLAPNGTAAVDAVGEGTTR